MIQLYSHQRTNADRLAELLVRYSAAADLSDTGTGKTFTALEVAKLLKARPLIITPKSVITSFARAAAEYGVEPLDVLNVEKLKTGKTPWVVKQPDGKLFWANLPPDSLIFADEAHRFGGFDSQNSWLLAVTKAQKLRILMMSATLADTPLRLRAAGYLFGLHSYNTGSFIGWCKAHGCRKATFHAGWLFPKGPSRLPHIEKIHRDIAPFCVRTRIKDIPGFPECSTQPILFDLAAKYTEEINKIYAEMDEELRKPNPMAPEMVIKQRARERVELIKIPLLADLVQESLDEGRSVVVFHNFRDALFALYEALMKIKGNEHLVISRIVGGDTNRQANIDAFQNDIARVCLCTAQAGGVGLSLHDIRGEFPRTSYLTPSWNAVDMKQCLGRIHRAGGLSKAIQRFVLAANTIEEQVHRNLTAKIANIDLLNDGDLF